MSIGEERERAMAEREHIKDVQLSTLQKILVGLFSAGCIWVGSTVYSMSVKIAVIQSQMGNLVSTNGDRYTASQAATDKSNFGNRVRAVEERVTRLEGKHGL